jgi:hypothetical protein
MSLLTGFSRPIIRIASLADDTKPVVRFCETDHGSRVLNAMGTRLPTDETHRTIKGGTA